MSQRLLVRFIVIAGKVIGWQQVSAVVANLAALAVVVCVLRMNGILVAGLLNRRSHVDRKQIARVTVHHVQLGGLLARLHAREGLLAGLKTSVSILRFQLLLLLALRLESR